MADVTALSERMENALLVSGDVHWKSCREERGAAPACLRADARRHQHAISAPVRVLLTGRRISAPR